MPCAFLLGGVLLASCDALGPRRPRAGGSSRPARSRRSSAARIWSSAGCVRSEAAARCDERARPAVRRRHVVERRQELDGHGHLRVAAAARRAVAPFKAQNMSNNSYPCRVGGEIGRAQVAQAEACGLEPEPAMNPILLKPSGNGTSQVVVNGRVWKTLSAREYYAHAEQLRGKVLDAYEDLVQPVRRDRDRRRRQRDRAEPARSRPGQPRPRHADSCAVAARRRHRARRRVRVGDRHESSADARRAVAVPRIRDQQVPWRRLAVRRGRADSRRANGVSLLRRISVRGRTSTWTPRTAWRSRRGRSVPAPAGARIAIVRFPHLSNATDFRLLTWADWIASPPAGEYDFVILPGSKNTIADLAWLRQVGLMDWVLTQHRRWGDGHRRLRRLSDAGTDRLRPDAGSSRRPEKRPASGCCPLSPRCPARSRRGRSSRRLEAV